MAFLLYLVANLVVWLIVIYNMRLLSQKAEMLVQKNYPDKWQHYVELGEQQGAKRWRYSAMWHAIKKSPQDFGQISEVYRLAKLREAWLATGLACIPITSIVHSIYS